MRDKDPHRNAQLKRRFQGIHKLFTSLHTSHAASTTQSTHQAQSLLYTAPRLTPAPQPASHAVTTQTSELVTQYLFTQCDSHGEDAHQMSILDHLFMHSSIVQNYAPVEDIIANVWGVVSTDNQVSYAMDHRAAVM